MQACALQSLLGHLAGYVDSYRRATCMACLLGISLVTPVRNIRQKDRTVTIHVNNNNHYCALDDRRTGIRDHFPFRRIYLSLIMYRPTLSQPSRPITSRHTISMDHADDGKGWAHSQTLDGLDPYKGHTNGTQTNPV